jgi:hypothetical protein
VKSGAGPLLHPKKQAKKNSSENIHSRRKKTKSFHQAHAGQGIL